MGNGIFAGFTTVFGKRRKVPHIFSQQLDELDYLRQIAIQLMVEKERELILIEGDFPK